MTLFLNGRSIVYTNAVVEDTDVLRSNLYKMVSNSKLAETILTAGLSNPTFAYGAPCTPSVVPGLSVSVGVGSIYSFSPLDATDYGSIPADTNPSHYLYKQGINFDPVQINTPAPIVAGNSVIHLIQAKFQEQDENLTATPYFNPVDPLNPIFIDGYDTRADLMVINFKQGVEGISPSPPSADAGYVPLYYVTVTFGQTVIVSGNISVAAGAPFITEGLTQKISQATGDTRYRNKKCNYAQVTFQSTTIQIVGINNSAVCQFDEVASDDNGWWDGINHRFIPNLIGKYRITGNLLHLATSPAIQSLRDYIAVFKNGSRLRQRLSDPFYSINPTKYGATSFISFIVEVNGSTDYLELVAENAQSVSTSIGWTGVVSDPATFENFFEIEYLGT